MFNQKQVFSIRKTFLGVASVTLGVLLVVPKVSAETISSSPVDPATTAMLLTDLTAPALVPETQLSSASIVWGADQNTPSTLAQPMQAIPEVGTSSAVVTPADTVPSASDVVNEATLLVSSLDSDVAPLSDEGQVSTIDEQPIVPSSSATSVVSLDDLNIEVSAEAVDSANDLTAQPPVAALAISETLSQPLESATEPDEVIPTHEAAPDVVIESPVLYVPTDEQAVGTERLVQSGQSGGLYVIPTTEGYTVERIEPTMTVVEVGTQPTVVTEERPAMTEYALDESRDYGDNQVVREAQAGHTTTTTTYRLIPGPNAYVDDKVFDDTYRYVTTPFYSIDKSQDLPSDQVVIDKLWLDIADSAAILPHLEAEKLNVFETSVRETAAMTGPSRGYYITRQVDPQTGQEVLKYHYVPAEYLHPSKLTKDLYPLMSEEDPYQSLFLTSIDQIKNVSSAWYLSFPIPVDGTTTLDELQRYHSSHFISEGLYADVKADYLRMEALRQQMLADGTFDYFEGNQARYEDAVRAFESITQRYNTAQGRPNVLIDYTDSQLDEGERIRFEAYIQSLPASIRQNLPKLVVSEQLDFHGKVSYPAGVSFPDMRLIMLSSAMNNGQAETLFATLLHELAHSIDQNSGTLGYSALSDSQDFKQVHETYFVGKVVPPYLANNIEEAFAESLSEYINQVVFGRRPKRYLIPDNPILAIYGVEEGDERYEAGYSPTEAAEFYFAKLYHQLFEQPQGYKVVEDTVKTVTKAAQNGLILLGAKPTEAIKVLAHQVRYLTDDTKDEGFLSETEGRDGKQVYRTRYVLENNELKPITELVEEVAALDKIIIKGTKKLSQIYDEIIDNLPKTPTESVVDKGTDQPADQPKHQSTDQTRDKGTGSSTGLVSDKVAEVVPSQPRVVKANQKPRAVSAPVGQPVQTLATKPGAHQVSAQPLAKAEKVSQVVAGQSETSASAPQTRMARYHSLPATGDHTSKTTSLLGLAVLGLGFVGLRRKKQN